jgi:hypothetical protein
MKIATALILAILFGAAAAPAANAVSEQEDAAMRASWQSRMNQTDTPDVGCYTAVYPDTAWKPVECGEAPDRPFMTDTVAFALSSHAANTPDVTGGNSSDYMATSTGGRKITWAQGSFPSERGVTRENDGGATDVYSLQLNTNRMNTGPCAAAAAGCQTWQQFIYESQSGTIFMQYWLINWRNKHASCPSGWWVAKPHCFMNSRTAFAGSDSARTLQLLAVMVTATAAKNGNDTVTYTVDNGPGAITQSWAVTNSDKVLSISAGWTASEFNIFGDFNSTRAVFNAGSSLIVQNAIDYAATNGAAPGCLNTSTTAETNNLNRHACTRHAGFSLGGVIDPGYILFDESN